MIALTLAAEALFASPLQPSDQPSPPEVDAAVTAQILAYGTDGLAAVLAQEYGDHPDLAAARMRWCVAVVRPTFQPAHA